MPPHLLITDPWSVSRWGRERAEPGGPAELLFSEEVRQEDEHDSFGVGSHGSPPMRFPHGLEPYISWGEINRPTWVVALLPPPQHHTNLNPFVQVYPQFRRARVSANGGIDGRLRGKWVVMPSGSPQPLGGSLQVGVAMWHMIASGNLHHTRQNHCQLMLPPLPRLIDNLLESYYLNQAS